MMYAIRQMQLQCTRDRERIYIIHINICVISAIPPDEQQRGWAMGTTVMGTTHLYRNMLCLKAHGHSDNSGNSNEESAYDINSCSYIGL